MYLKHKRYYAVLNFYIDSKRVPKWIPTGLLERDYKKEVVRITNLLSQLFNRDGTFISKRQSLSHNSLKKIICEMDLPDITFKSLCKYHDVSYQHLQPGL